MNNTQMSFRQKVIRSGMIVFVIVFVVFCITAINSYAQMQGTGTVQTGKAPVDPGVVQYGFLAAAIAVSVGSVGAGIAVGYVGAAAMGAIGEKPELSGRALIFVGLAEGIAIYGLIIAIMILSKL